MHLAISFFLSRYQSGYPTYIIVLDPTLSPSVLPTLAPTGEPTISKFHFTKISELSLVYVQLIYLFTNSSILNPGPTYLETEVEVLPTSLPTSSPTYLEETKEPTLSKFQHLVIHWVYLRWIFTGFSRIYFLFTTDFI